MKRNIFIQNITTRKKSKWLNKKKSLLDIWLNNQMLYHQNFFLTAKNNINGSI